MSATQRELLEERWNLLLRDVARFGDEPDISAINSKRHERIDDTLEELGALLVDEVSGAELDTLRAAITDIWINARERLLAWAETTEQQRAERRAQMAAYVAPYTLAGKA
jgi:hypothetical protein